MLIKATLIERRQTYRGDTMNNQLLHQRREILRLAGKYGINNVRVFGSIVRGDEKKDTVMLIYWSMSKMGEIYSM